MGDNEREQKSFYGLGSTLAVKKFKEVQLKKPDGCDVSMTDPHIIGLGYKGKDGIIATYNVVVKNIREISNNGR